MIKQNMLTLLLIFPAWSCGPDTGHQEKLPGLRVSENGHWLETNLGESFFWLGDTGWLLLKKLDRKETEYYLEDRAEKGFNVIQAMVIHELHNCINFAGDSAFHGKDISLPVVTEGQDPADAAAYDYWDHVEYVIDLAAEKGIYMALVPIWGTNVRKFPLTPGQAAFYGKWLAERYCNKRNVIWLNGGDSRGSDSTAFWKALGQSLKTSDPDHLVTFHPFGRTQSSTWFHNEPWLDFNMIQSGHRRYDQDDSELAYGEDNWRYIESDYRRKPTRPTLDGEPSYEGLPQGLHDTTQPLWNDADMRRYAYWSIFAGACGFTYGHREVMQFYRPERDRPDYGATHHWKEVLDAPGAGQMIHLKNLLVSRSMQELRPDQALVAGPRGKRYSYIAACRGDDYALLYTYTGRNMDVAMGKIRGRRINASWYDPRTGKSTEPDEYENTGTIAFDPPGVEENGNDWVLVLETIN